MRTLYLIYYNIIFIFWEDEDDQGKIISMTREENIQYNPWLEPAIAFAWENMDFPEAPIEVHDHGLIPGQRLHAGWIAILREHDIYPGEEYPNIQAIWDKLSIKSKSYNYEES